MRVIIWGCGDYGRKILPNLIEQGDKEIIAYTDSNEKLWGQKVLSIPVISPEQIRNTVFDLLLIVVSSPGAVRHIKEYIGKLHISKNKIVDVFTDIDYMDLFADQRTRFIKGYADWINKNNIEGNVAEWDVCRGDSAKFINRYFPNRKLYMCDTFEGFDSEDLQYEKDKDNKYFNQSKFADQSFFVDTGVDYVMCKMMYPENVVIKKGYFPESMSGVEDKFCFVNLDMDLYIPMLNGLRFFWDKMIQGGCILMHDYFSNLFAGVKQAVDIFEKEREINIVKSPIGDGSSIALFFI